MNEIIKQTTSSAKDQYATQALFMCLMAGVFYCYEYYLRVAPSVMMPELLRHYNISTASFGYLVAYYYVAYVPLQIPVGLLMDRFGPKRILTIACLLCALGTYLFVISDILYMAKLGRCLIGFGSAFAYVGVLKISALWLHKRYFGMMAGFCTALGMLGAVSGELLLTSLIKYIDWQHALFGSAIVGLGLAVVLWMVIWEMPEPKIYQQKSFTNLWQEVKQVFVNKQLCINGIIGCLLFLPLTAFAELWAINYLQSLHLTEIKASFGSSLVFLGYAAGAPLWGKITESMQSRRAPMLIGAIVAFALSICIILLPQLNITTMIIFILMFLFGFFASAQVIVFSVAHDVGITKLSATTLAFTNLLVMLGGLAAQPLVGQIYAFLPSIQSSCEVLRYQISLLILPVGLLCAIMLVLFSQESYSDE